MELCTNFEELGGIWENHQILSPKIVVWGGRNSWKSGGKFSKKRSWGALQLERGEYDVMKSGMDKISAFTPVRVKKLLRNS